MKKWKALLFLLLWTPIVLYSQAIEIVSYGENPLIVDPLTGSNLTVNYKYTSEAGSSGNHLFIGLEILDENNNYVSYINGATLENQTAGIDKTGSVSFFVGSSNKTSADLPSGHYYQVKAVLFASGGWTENAWAGYWNSPALNLEIDGKQQFSTNKIAKGADISWMTEMESKGYTWKDNEGTAKELMPLLKEYDLEAVRLRVWVNPENSGANGWCDIDDLVAKAEKAKANNLDIMICVHYSDWWADPGQQTKPAAWTNYTIAQLENAVANHTTEILTALQAKGITPKWIQIGNETNDGMLWTSGKASAGGFANYAKFLNAGANAVKSFNSSIKTILHIASGNDNNLFKWNIGGLLNNGFQIDTFDIIGMSLYPDENNWKSYVDATYNNMLDMKSRYNKDVMMVEVGFSNNNPDVAHQFLTYMIERTKQAQGLGVFYWEPIAHGNFTSYSKGAWDDDGSPSVVMDAFMEQSVLNTGSFELKNNSLFQIYPNPSAHSITIKTLDANLDINLETIHIFDVTGKKIRTVQAAGTITTINISTLKSGIYILKMNNTHSLRFLKK
ncbi:MAG: arabinogalactan endo-1,4-beta-galactosidase [Polaribacter sp.]|jgi:arabinogalactan endo-1,4-beta-galactosidase